MEQKKSDLAIVDCHCNAAACSLYERRGGRDPATP